MSDWITIAEAADALRVHHRTVRNMIDRGDIPSRRIGPRLIRVDISGVAPIGDDPIEDHIARVVAQAPALSDSQRARLAAIFERDAAAPIDRERR